MEMTKTYTVLEAIQFISKSCDWAKKLDGVGFNAADSSMNLVACYSKLTLEQQEHYRTIVYKYKNQLGINSINDLKIVDYGSSNKVIMFTQHDERIQYVYKGLKKSIKYGEGEIIISFDYEANVVAAIKELNDRKFNYEEKNWSVKVTKGSIPQIEKFLNRFFFEFDKEKLSNCISEKNKPSKVIELEGEDLLIKFEYDPKSIELVKKISGRKFNANKKCWVVKLDSQSITSVMEFHKENPEFEMSPEAMVAVFETAKKFEEKLNLMQENIEASSSMTSDLEVPTFKGILRPFQKAGVKYIVNNPRTIVGDEMGLGKTIETIAATEYTGDYPVLVSCPNSLKYNWRREYTRFTDRTVAVINSETTEFNEADVYIANYNTLVKFEDKFKSIKFKAVVSDESHLLKNQKAQRTKSFTNIVDECNPHMVLLLTGTVIKNRPNELISPLSILGKLDEFGGFWKFATRYCNAHRGSFGLDISGSSNLEELHQKLRSICYIRRNKEDVLTELPAKARQVIELDIDNRSKYEKAKDDLINYLKNEVELDQKFLDSITDLTEEESVSAVKEYRKLKAKNAEQAEHLVRINELKKLCAAGKLNEAKSWIKDVIDSGEKLVVFAIHTNMVNSIAKEFGCNKIDGSVKPEDRDKFVQDFQNNPETKLIVLNIEAGSVGLTLTAASKLAFIELGWTPGEHDQAEDRIHRMTQEEACNIYYLIATDTIDIEIFNLIEEKRVVTNAVNKGSSIEGNVSILNELIKRLTS